MNSNRNPVMHHMVLIQPRPAAVRYPLRRIGRFLQVLALHVVAAQCHMRERGQIAELSDAALKDLGLTRADIGAELNKPVWRR
jgi:uncharacterized protein YjiS (DUF1127 family)